MKNLDQKKIDLFGEYLSRNELRKLQKVYQLTDKERTFLKRITFTDEGVVPTNLATPADVAKMTIQLGVIDTGLYDYIKGVNMLGEMAKLIDPLVNEKLKTAKAIFEKVNPEAFLIVKFD